MTTPKLPNLSQKLLLWLASAQVPGPAQAEQPGGARCYCKPQDRPELVRYAQNAQGLLAQRDPAALRRFVLDADSEAEQNFRQEMLFAMAGTRLTKWAHGGPPHAAGSKPRVVQAGLYALPVVFCMEQSVSIRSSFNFDSQRSVGLKAALAHAFAQGLRLVPSDVRIRDAVAVQYLAGVSPLSVQSSMIDQLTGAPVSTVHIPEVTEPDRLKVLMSPGAQEFVSVGRDSPGALLITAIVAWDTDRSAPVFTDPLQSASQRMQALLQALFTHAQPTGAQQVATSADGLVHSEVRVGQIQPLHDALTESQWMQLAWMAERARRSDCSFCLEHHHELEITTWSASLTNDSEEVVAQLGYAYNSFWRPIQHAHTIAEKVGMAQGTGRMATDPFQDPLPH